MEQMTANLLPALGRHEPAETVEPGDYIRLVDGTEPTFHEVTAVHVELDSTLILFGQGRSVIRHPEEACFIVRAAQVAVQDALTAKHRRQHLRDARARSGREDAFYGVPPRGWEP